MRVLIGKVALFRHHLAAVNSLSEIIATPNEFRNAIIGYLTARNSLRPLRRMAETASDISASRLDRRLEVTNAPQELKVLAAGFNAMLERLRNSFSRLSDFFSNLAHERKSTSGRSWTRSPSSMKCWPTRPG